MTRALPMSMPSPSASFGSCTGETGCSVGVVGGGVPANSRESDESRRRAWWRRQHRPDDRDRRGRSDRGKVDDRGRPACGATEETGAEWSRWPR